MGEGYVQDSPEAAPRVSQRDKICHIYKTALGVEPAIQEETKLKSQ